jgi:pimeloyl-ACP methyl ester carboxylesterase
MTAITYGGSPTATGQTIVVADGTTLAYREVGPAGGAPVVLLHGLSDSALSFQPVLEQLSTAVHAYALTQRGHHGSDAPPSGYEADQLARDVLAFMDAVGLERAVIAGHSLGALVALRAAALGPERVTGLVLIGGFATGPSNPQVLELAEVLDGLSDPIDPELVASFQASTAVAPVSPAFIEAMVEGSLQVPADVWRQLLAGFLAADPLEDAARVSVPVLVVHGEQDAYVPAADPEVFVRALPAARSVTYEATGHAIHWERPERFTADLEAFVVDCRSGALQTVNGTPLYSATTGTGEPLVLVHGGWTDHHSWDLVTPGLAESFQVTRYDRSGHTLSPRRPAGTSRRMDEDDLVALIESIGGGPVHLVGNSYGASIVLGVVARRPDLVRAAAVHEPPLLGVAERDPALAPLAAAARADLERVAAQIRTGDVDGGLRTFVEEVALGPGNWERLPEQLRRTMAANRRTFLDMLDDPTWADLDLTCLRRTEVPVQLSVGDESPRWLLAVASAVRAHLPGASHVLYQGAGHIPQITDAEEYVDRVTAFLAAR